MSSDKSEEDEDHDVISRQIVDYYRKYSQSQHLPKYFSGTSLSYMPPIVKEEELTKQPPIIIVDDTNTETLIATETVSIQTEVPTEHKIASPTNSITSNKKLEWDNGADIGYNNCNRNVKLHKSASLPILISSTSKTSNKTSPVKLQTEIVNVISYADSDHNMEEADDVGDNQVQWPSSSSSSYHKDVPIESSTSSVQTSKKQVSSSSSSLQSTVAYLKSKIGTPKAESTPKLSLGIQVYTETPFVPKAKKNRVTLCVTKPIVVQCFDTKKKKGSDKIVQTSFAELVSQCVQTGDSLKGLDQQASVHNVVENQSIILIKYYSGSDEKTHSTNSQTSGEMVASECNSFEYYKNCQKEQQATANEDSEISQAKSNLVASTDSSKEIPLLGQLISRKQSTSLIGDIDKSIELLQKLLKSKKYDATTKKRYIKKIVAKIVNGQYSEDSTSSSDLFIPKKQDNLVENRETQPPQVSKFTVKTFSNAYLPIQTSEEQKPQQENKSSSDDKQQNISGGSYQSWKENKTKSETLLEQKHRGQGDELIEFAQKERQHQLSWINNEISHLTKLKGLLEKRVQKTTTTVYMMSQDSTSSGRTSCPCSSGSNLSRNYVIQTDVSSSISGDLPTNYKLHGDGGTKKYQVRKLSEGENSKVGDIEVVSDDKTTNIKITTANIENESPKESLFKPKAPLLMGFTKGSTFPRARSEEERCRPCGMLKQQADLQKSGTGSTKQLSFEIPLYSQSSLSEKVKDIIKKYGSDAPANKLGRCVCDCKCSKKRLPVTMQETFKCSCICKRFSTSSEPSRPTNLPNMRPLRDYAKCQTKDCNCCNKPLQAKPCNKAKCMLPQCKNQHKDVQVCICTDQRCQTEAESKDAGNSIYDEKYHSGPWEKPEQAVPKKTCNDSKCQSEECQMQHNYTQVCICIDQKCQTSASSDIENWRSDPTKKLDDEAPSKSCDEEKCQREECKMQHKDTQVCICSDQRCQTEPERSERNQEIQTDSGKSRSRSETTFSSSSSFDCRGGSSLSQSIHSCICCKRKNITSKYLYHLRQKLSEPLCRPCYRQHRHACHPAGFYNNPAHVCRCYTMVQTDTLNEIKKTINDLNELDQYCTCTNGSNYGNNSDYCKYCKCKLKKTSNSRNGIAYMITFEDASLREAAKEKRKKERRLEEIKIKVPVSYKKKHKDKENKKKKEKGSNDSEDTSASENGNKVTVTTLQDYLNTNRPDFVEDAEGRRKAVNKSKTKREEMTDYNKLQFLQKCQDECEKNARRIFSNKEIREINRRNYKKLPEVRQKLIDNKNKQLRQADRLIAETFNRKLRENVLRGRRDIPTNKKVIDM